MSEENRLELQGDVIKDFKKFLNACKTAVREDPTIHIEPDRVKVDCGSGKFKFFGEAKPEIFTEYSIQKPALCKLNFKDVTSLINRDINRMKIKSENGKLKINYYKDFDKEVYGSELECSK